MSMRLKKGVKINGIRSELVLALNIINSIYEAYNSELVITSVVEGKHMPKSLHYVGFAVDLRPPENDDVRDLVFEEIKDSLKEDFDVLEEGNHFHIEYQPKSPHLL